MDKGIKEIIMAAAQVTLLRYGDVETEDGSYATVDIDCLLHLESAIAEYFQLPSDDVTFENMDELITKIRGLL